MNVARGLVIVRPVTTEETLGGGRIILTRKSRENLTAHQMLVVDVGLEAICDDDECGRWHYPSDEAKVRFHRKAPSVRPGAWVLVRPRSLVDAGTYPDKQYFVRQDDVLAVFEVA